jgi:hypothetical protein
MDQEEATAVSQTEDCLLARRPDGTMIEITPDGEVRDAEDVPGPTEAEVIEGEAQEVPVDGAEEATNEEIEAAKPTAVELAVDPNDPTDVYRKMDRADEVLILEELQGRALQTFVYSFESGGKRQTDLTVAGVNEAVRLMNERGGTQIGISEQPPVVEHEERGGEEYVRVMVFARDDRMRGSGRWGTAIEPVKHQSGKSKGQWDKFAFTKALNKAERNALKKQIPEDFRQTIIAQYLGTVHQQALKSIENLKVAGGGSVGELPSGPVLEGEEAEALRAEINDLYRQLRELNPLKWPPAAKTQHLRQAESDSLERMEALRDTVQDWIEGERARQAGEQPS